MPASPRVLVIDDSAFALELVRHALASEGMLVTCVSDLTAFETARAASPPDIIILDVQMPEIFGDDLAATLRGAYGVSVPIFLFSSLDDEELQRRATEAAVTGFVSKRAGMAALVARVKEALRGPASAPDSAPAQHAREGEE